jgi:thiamine-monophosphate kinase
VEAFRRPVALLRAGRGLLGRARSCCDVSDGLARDALHLAQASGVRLVLEAKALRASLRPELSALAAELAADPLELALHGGEDYALLCTGPRARRPRAARRIGRVVRGRGVVLESPDGTLRPAAGGHDHLRPR